jgi:hypothetical protein
MTRADEAVRGYTCPIDRGGCGAAPGTRCTALQGSRRTLLHPHRVRVALVARPARGPSDHALASWLRSHAHALRMVLDRSTPHGAALAEEFDRLLPEAPAEGG